MPYTRPTSCKPASPDALFGAFADPTRLRILNILTVGETCVCDLMAVLGVPQAKVSRHLSRLRRCGLVVARKQGLWHYYSIAPARSVLHTKLIECLGSASGEFPEWRRDLVKIRRTRCGDECC